MKQSLLCFFICSSLLLHAQDVYDTVAKETCECIQKKDISTMTRKSIEMALGLCMFEVAQNNKMEFDVTDQEAMRALGQKVGLKMAPICPDVFSIIANDKSVVASQQLSISGKVKSVDEGEFVFVTVKDDNNKETKLIWLRYFKGSDEFVENPKKLIGKTVNCKYQPVDAYMPKAKVYYSYKEITELTVN